MSALVKRALTLMVAIAMPLPALANQPGNAALRYWAAFSEMRDSALNSQQAKELRSILDGTAPYDDAEYRNLVEKNHLALEVMSRGTLLTACDWGLDYNLGKDMPAEYVKEALTLGRLNVLYTFHLLKGGNMEAVVPALIAGLRFSHDVGNGGSLFATVVAESLLVDHLRAMEGILRIRQLSADQHSRLQMAIAGSRLDLDWSSAAKKEFQLLRREFKQSSTTASALDSVEKSYIAAVRGESTKASAELTLKAAPKDLANVVPNLGGVLKAKDDLTNAIRQARTALQ